MPDETGTETTRSDAPSADESLFGDAADDTAAAAAEEQDANEETEQDPEGADDAEEQAVGDETETSEDLKVVVSIKGGRATIGVQRTSSDPHIESFDEPGPVRADAGGLGGHRTGREPSGERNSSIRPTRDPLPRPSVRPGVRRGRRRPGALREGQTNSNPRR